MSYPKFHRKIVNTLLEGKFVLYKHEIFEELEKEREFYISFFQNTFGYELNIRSEFAYLSSDKTDESFSKNLTLMLCLLCYELNQQTENFKTKIETGIFSIDEVESYLQNPNFEELVNDIGSIQSMCSKLSSKNIIEWIDRENGQFKFTSAIDLFFEFAVELSKSPILENSNIED